MNSSSINWQKLAEIKELKGYFNDDFQEFKKSICHYLKIMAKMSSTSIQEIAIIRALEVTNGCTQHSYRRNDSDCLSVEQTRECMKLSISSI
ncbi:MAG: hypothetical protein D6822_05245, partial [Cyanobacteria bacterium J149]